MDSTALARPGTSSHGLATWRASTDTSRDSLFEMAGSSDSEAGSSECRESVMRESVMLDQDLQPVRGSYGRMEAAEGSLIARDVVTDQIYTNVGPIFLRVQLLFLGLIKAPLLFPIQILFRAVDTLALGFIRRGIDSAYASHLATYGKDPYLEPRRVTKLAYAGHILKELVKDIVKLAILPFAFIARTFVALVGGIFAPFQARRVIEKIEQFSYVTPTNMWQPSNILEDIGGNVTAPCFLSKKFNAEHNRYREYPSSHYHEKCTRTQLNRFMHTFIRLQEPLAMMAQHGQGSRNITLIRQCFDLVKNHRTVIAARLGQIATPRAESHMWHTQYESVLYRDTNNVVILTSARLAKLTEYAEKTAMKRACGDEFVDLEIIARETPQIVQALLGDLGILETEE